MTPRQRRLYADHAGMVELAAEGLLDFVADGNPPETYRVCLHAPGVALDADSQPRARALHRFDVYLHLDYPRRPPVVVWQTPIFHPNILPPNRNGGVCLGAWSASESLGDVCRRLDRLIRYESFNTSDALDLEAAAWVRDCGVAGAADIARLVGRPPALT